MLDFSLIEICGFARKSGSADCFSPIENEIKAMEGLGNTTVHFYPQEIRESNATEYDVIVKMFGLANANRVILFSDVGRIIRRHFSRLPDLPAIREIFFFCK